MKAYRLLLLLLAIATVVVSLGVAAGCSADDDDDDDDDSGDDDNGDDDTGGDIDDVPDDVKDFLDQDDLDTLEDGGMNIYTGDNPPDVEGEYYLDSLVVTYDEVGLDGMTIVPYTMKYYDQTAAGELKNDYEAPSANDYGDGIGGFIAGDDGCFTAFFDFEGETNGCEYQMPALHSGCMDTNGIGDFQWGFIMKSKTGSNCDSLIPEGAARIVDETDGLAAEQ